MRIVTLAFVFGAFNMFFVPGGNFSSGENLVFDTIGKIPGDTFFIKAAALDSFGSYCDRRDFECDCSCAEKIRFKIIDSLKTTFRQNEVIDVMARQIDLSGLRIVPDSIYILGISKSHSRIVFKENTLAIFETRVVRLQQ
jgi:hypothetical protein